MKSVEYDKSFLEAIKNSGLKYTAAYIERFGSDLNPWFANGMGNRKRQEGFYKRCVEEGHPWDYYVDAPPEDVIL